MVCGWFCGAKGEILRKNNFKLEFKYPTKEELTKLRKIHKDLNQSEKDAYTQIDNLKNLIKSKNIDLNVFKNLVTTHPTN